MPSHSIADQPSTRFSKLLHAASLVLAREALRVVDDGPGIPEQDRHRALESFVQLQQSGAKKAGFGLGLAIVKRAIEWHSGEVIISRSPLGGARISATWPAVLPTPPVHAPYPH